MHIIAYGWCYIKKLSYGFVLSVFYLIKYHHKNFKIIIMVRLVEDIKFQFYYLDEDIFFVEEIIEGNLHKNYEI